MNDEKVERKIAIILATDVVGYSTRMEKNEDQTLHTLRGLPKNYPEPVGPGA
ncbi:MAG: hypothetical protein HOJ66_03535 [Acidiferrobacteraceae bacterium]|jgi:hypothetical protein|nr:hypothetical protein [Acidiferrobacteraceae bacterium]